MADEKTLKMIRTAFGDPAARPLVVDGDVLDPANLPGLPYGWPSFPRPSDPALEPSNVFRPVPRGGRR